VGREGAAVGGEHSSRFSPRWLARETEFLRGASAVLVMGPSTRDVLCRDYDIAPERVHVVGAGPNTSLGPAVAPRDRGRRLLFVGTQWELKGGPTLVAAFRELRKDFPEATLTLVGSGPSSDLPEGVRSLGRVPHDRMAAIYDEADLVVMPTHMEAFGIALVEALQKGLPCVCSDVGNQRGIVGDAGLAITPGDVAGLRAALGRLLSDYPAFQQRALRRGAELRSSMSWERVADEVVTQLGVSTP
jgi:glycosyltransferase involved in cell wall biosynthesis